MNKYYPMATYDGKTDNFHTLTTYDSLFSEDECLDVIRTWISMGYKIDKCWIQCFMEDLYNDDSIEIEVKISLDNTPYIVGRTVDFPGELARDLEMATVHDGDLLCHSIYLLK